MCVMSIAVVALANANYSYPSIVEDRQDSNGWQGSSELVDCRCI